MNNLYLVCTRSAISGSAFTYVMNSSPDFYNLCHNNLWLEEHSEKFGTAHIINDWWNVSDQFKAATGYNSDIRNTESLDEDEVVQLANGFEELNLGKNMCIFTHARNLEEIKEYRDKHKLPIVLVSTLVGSQSHHFISSWLRREYNDQMNEYENLQEAWKYLYTQRIYNDDEWSDHMDYSFRMYDYLKDPQYVYKTLNISPNEHMSVWTDQYLLRNDSLYLEYDLENVDHYAGARYKLTLLMHMLDEVRLFCHSSHQQIKAACIMFTAIQNAEFNTSKEIVTHCLDVLHVDT